MSTSKMVPDYQKPRECERTKLRKPPPVPYVPEKDDVQEEISKTRNMEIKTLIEKDTNMKCLHSAHPRDATKDRATRGCPIPMRPSIAVNRCVVVLLCCCVVVLLCCCVVVLKAGDKMKEPVVNLHTQYFPLK